VLAPSVAYVAVAVVATPLVARIIGGDRQIWADASAPPCALDARTSYDPDDVTGGGSAVSPLRFVWSCTLLSAQSPCFNAANPFQSGTVPIVSLPAASLLQNGQAVDSYVFSVTVTRDGRATTSVPVVIQPVLLPLPQLSITLAVPTQGPFWVVINPNDKVQLSAVVTQLALFPVSYTLLWTCPSGNVNVSLGSPALSTSPLSPDLVVLPGNLVGGQSYVFSVLLTNANNPMQFTSTTVGFAVNSAPVGGTCLSAPLSGLAVTDTFTLSCTSWSDAVTDYPLAYRFTTFDPLTQATQLVLQEYVTVSRPVACGTRAALSIRIVCVVCVFPAHVFVYFVTKLLLVGVSECFKMRSYSAINVFSGVLPAGSPLLIRVNVRDRWGATTNVLLSVNVTMPVVTTTALNVLATTVQQKLLFATDTVDLNMASAYIGAMTSVLSAASSVSSSSSSSSSSSADTQQRAGIRAHMLTSLVIISQANGVPTAAAIGQAMMAAASIVSVAQPAELLTSVQVQAITFAAQQFEAALALGGSLSTLAQTSANISASLPVSLLQSTLLILSSASTSTSFSLTSNATSGNSTSMTSATAAQLSKSTAATAALLVQGALIGFLPGEAPVQLISSAITVRAQRLSTAVVQENNFSLAFVSNGNSAAASTTGACQVTLPSTLMTDTFGGASSIPPALDAAMIVYTNNMYVFMRVCLWLDCVNATG
jgi:hypothetical protein